MGKEKTKNEHPEWKTTRKERLSYAIGFNGGVGENVLYQTYLTTYLIMTGMDLSHVAGVLLVIKMIDALDDLFIGWIIDRIRPEQFAKIQKISGNGRFLPWLRLTFWIMPIAVVFLYHIPTGTSELFKMTWFCVTYLIADFSYTFLDVPMNALLTTITSDTHERDRIIMLRLVFQLIIVVSIYFLFTFVISESVGMSISMAVTIFTAVMVACMIPMVLHVKEHSVMNEENKDSELSLLAAIKCVFTNRNLLSYYGGSILSGCFATGSAASLFASYYLFGSSMFSIVMSLPMMAMVYLMSVFVPKIAMNHDKNKVRMIALAIGLITGPLVYFVGYESIPKYIIATIINVIPAGVAGAISPYLLPNCIEYGKYTSGKDATSISFAFGTFACKFPSAIASALGLWILSMFGWQSIEAESFAEIAALNIVQSESAIHGLWLITAGIPVVGSVLAFIAYLFYNVTDKDAAIMAKCNSGEITRQEAESLLSKRY